MKDLNFFSESLKSRKLAQRKRTIITTVVLVTVLIIGGAYGILEMTAVAFSTDISQMDKYMKSVEVTAKQKDIEVKKAKLVVMKEYAAAIDTVDEDFKKSSILKSKLLEDIYKTLPSGAFFTALDFDGNSFTLKGYSDSRASIAELAHNLGSLDVFDKVHIVSTGSAEANTTTTTTAGSSVDFEISCSVKGGMDE